jgi:hypothetical protein
MFSCQQRCGTRARGWLIGCLLIVAGGLVVWRLTWMAPRWWAPPDPRNEQIVALAERVEQRVLEVAHEVRPADEQWIVRIREYQVNAWLSARLPEWARRQDLDWPARLGMPQARFDDTGISVAIEVHGPRRSRFIVARLIPELVDEQLLVRLDRVTLGRLPLPGEPLQAISEVLGDVGALAAGGPLLDALAAGTPIDPVWELGDGRHVRLLDVHYAAGHLELTCRTLQPGSDPE